MTDLPRPTFDRLISENGGIQRFRSELAAGVAARLQLVEPGGLTGSGKNPQHPDRAILDRISDPVARAIYEKRIEMEDRTGVTPGNVSWIDGDDGWEDDDG